MSITEKETKTKERNDSIWTVYNVRWDFIRDLCGSVPANGNLVGPWLDSRAPDVMPAGGKSIDEITEEVLDTLTNPTTAAIPLRVFQKKNEVLVVREDTIRAHLKDCARVISAQFIGKIKGERSFATRVVNGAYLDEANEYIPILRPDGTPVTAADEVLDKPVHARGPRGEPINALKSFEVVRPAMIKFRLKILGTSVSIKDLSTLMNYGGTHGYGGERSAGGGKYIATIEEAS